MRKSLFLLVAVLFYFILVDAGAQQYNFKTYSIESGLPQSDVNCLMQDSRGYIWLGTNGGGACRFDGIKFLTFNKMQNLASNVVRCIIEDKGGNIWFGTDDGITFYNGLSFRTITEEQGLSHHVIVSMFEDAAGNIWVGTSEGGLNKISFTPEDSVSVDIINKDNGLNNNMIMDIEEDLHNRLWLATFGGGINILTFKEDTFIVDIIQKIDIPSNLILTVDQDMNDDMWIGSYDGGAFKIKNDDNFQNPEVIFTKLNNMPIWDIQPDPDGTTWFASDANGLIHMDNEVYEYYDETNGLPNNQILSILEDEEGNIWSGTMGSGLCMFQGKELVHYSSADGLSKNQVSTITQDNEGAYWIGTFGGGLYKCDFSLDSVVLMNYTEETGLINNAVLSLDVDKNNNIWIGTKDGSCMFDGKEFVYNFTVHEGMPNNQINTLCVDNEGIVWMGTIGGIAMFDGVGIIPYTIPVEYDLINEIQTIIESKDGTMWFGTWGGLAESSGSTMYIYDEEDGLMDKKINALVEDVNHNIWIGTFGGGLYVLDRNTTDSVPIKLVATDEILSSNNINSLIFENDQTLIVGTNKGIDRLQLNSDHEIIKIKNYDPSNGFIGGETKTNAIHKDGLGNIWIGTVIGVTKYTSRFSRVTDIPPKTNITNIKLFFEDVDWVDKTGTKAPWFNVPKNLNLKYSDNHLTFIFSGISYTNPGKVFYKYKMDGLETDWSPPRKEAEAVYSGLSPGDYTLQVIAVNENNNWNKEPVTFSFTIEPPFWKTTWFIVLCILVIVILIVTYIKVRERKLIYEKKILEQKVKERTFEIEQKKEEIEAQRDEIENQRDHIEIQLQVSEKQKHMIEEQQQEILDSIHYAKRIQTAILPPQESVSKNISDLFILFKPKDIVSGDFHWSGKKGELIIIAAADCTGHGVPGAFMSMLGVSFLNQIVMEKGVTQPNKIINLLRVHIINALQQKGSEGEAKDGMDMALVTIDSAKNKLYFAGANNPMYYVRDNELTETKPDKMPVAIYLRMDKFTNHEIDTQSGDCFYLFSDGFADQFGGPKGKKFKYKPFKELLVSNSDKSMDDQMTILDTAIEDWKAFTDPVTDENFEQIDDIVVIGGRI